MRKLIYLVLGFLVSFCSSEVRKSEGIGGKDGRDERNEKKKLTEYRGEFQFSDRETRFIHRKGSGMIFGKAFLKREEDKGMMTCAGSEVLLIPATSYSSERIRFFYGNTKKGFSKKMQRLEDGPKRYYENRREAKCDRRGRFQFMNVPEGQYYVITSIYWKVESLAGEFKKGGEIMKRIELKKGEKKQLMIYEMTKASKRLGNKIMI